MPASSPVIQCAHSAYRLAEVLLARAPELRVFQTWDSADTLDQLAETEVLVISGFWRNEWLTAAPRLRFVQLCSAGYDHCDLAAFRAAGVGLANAAGANSEAVSEHAMALLLALTRQVHVARDNQQRKHWRGMISDRSRRERELADRTMLIYGSGRIGSRLAELARAFGMTVYGVRRNPGEPSPAFSGIHPPEALDGLLPRADVVVLTCPLTAATRGLANAAFFARMRPDAYFINVARGGCVDEAALIDALQQHRIAGAGIDCTASEPLPPDSPLWSLENVLITPHTAGETDRYEDNVVDILLDNLDRLSRGETQLRNGIV
jgi:phosphoglycerate dehydrogenase-like enzyme